jgi:nifR3 family TIM-barrel protein
MRIGSVSIAHPFALAPLEEHSNYPFRKLMKRFGASLTCSERVDAAEVARDDRRAMKRLFTRPDEAPRAGQVSGSDAGVMAEAARRIEQLGFDLVDLNFDCSVRRLLDRGEGGALMSDPPAIARLVAAVVKAVTIPTTIKIRTGPDGKHETAVEVARLAAEAGAAAVSLHARSVAQAYADAPDWDIVRRVKESIRIPLFGGGGVRTADDALQLLRETGADGVAIGRGCLGNPWIFQQSRMRINGTKAISPPSLSERGRVLLQLAEGEFQLYGNTLALRRLSRMSGYFAQSLAKCGDFRIAVSKVRNFDQFRRLVGEFFR